MGKRRKNSAQLTFNILPIDVKATRLAVEDYLEEVRVYRQIGFVRREAAMTPSYEPRLHGNTNAISKPAEDAAVWNVSKEQELKRKSELLSMAMDRLKRAQREIIQRSYLDAEGAFDYISCGEMGMSDSTYRREKNEAISWLAAALRLQKYEDSETVEVG